MRSTALVSSVLIAALFTAILILAAGCGGGSGGNLAHYKVILLPAGTELVPPCSVTVGQAFRLLPASCDYTVKEGANLVTQENSNTFLAVGEGKVVIIGTESNGSEQEIEITIEAGFDPRFLTAASSPNPPGTTLGTVTPSGDNGANYQVFVRDNRLVIKKLSDGREVFEQPSVSGSVNALAARRSVADNRFDIVTIEGDGNIYDYNGEAGELVASAAGCKYIAIDGEEVVASIVGMEVNLVKYLLGMVAAMSGSQ